MAKAEAESRSQRCPCSMGCKAMPVRLAIKPEVVCLQGKTCDPQWEITARRPVDGQSSSTWKAPLPPPQTGVRKSSLQGGWITMNEEVGKDCPGRRHAPRRPPTPETREAETKQSPQPHFKQPRRKLRGHSGRVRTHSAQPLRSRGGAQGWGNCSL